MKHFISLLGFLLLPITSCYSQKSALVDIQYIVLTDTFLVKEIERLIQEEVNGDAGTTTDAKVHTESVFRKGLGYINLYFESNFQGDTIAKYYIAPSLVSIKNDATDNRYPPYYTYIGGRLVLVYVPILESVTSMYFSSKSKRKLRKRIDAILEKPQDVTAYNMDGSIAFRNKDFRIGYFKFHGGRYIYILKDKPPIVVNESGSSF